MKKLAASLVSWLLLLSLLGTVFSQVPGNVHLPREARAQDYQEFGMITQLGELNEGRYNHTATLLGDGGVLVIGGTQDGKTSLDSAELFSPVPGSWTQTARMSTGRMRHTATLLGSGTVLVAGGYDGTGWGHPSLFKHFNGTGNMSLNTCGLFDPGQGGFSPGPELGTGRFWHRSALLRDGRVLVIGGLNVSVGALSSCELYDPGTNEWTPAAPLNTARVRFTATLLNNGSVLVVGGHDGTKKQPFSSCELYVPEKDAWYEFAPMNRARGYHSVALMGDGRVMVTGGFSGPGQPDWSDAEIYDPQKNNWTLVGNMSLPRHNHETVAVDGGEVLVFGGSNCLTGGAHSGIEYYAQADGAWHNTHLVILGLKWTLATTLDNGSVLITGGKACADASRSCYVYTTPGKEGGTTEEDPWFIPGFEIALLVVAVTFVSFLIQDSSRPPCGKVEKTLEKKKRDLNDRQGSKR